jgi:recombination protein RecT
MKNETNVRGLLAEYRTAFERVAPKHLDVNRMLRVALMTVSRSSYLLDCTGSSLLGAFMLAAQLGLDIASREAYLVPFKNKNGMREVQLVPDYRGIMKLVRNSGQVANMRARLVYKEDYFVQEEGFNQRLDHIPNYDVEKEDRNIIGAYTIADFCDKDQKPTGFKDAHFLPIQHLLRIKAKSPAADSGPWKDFFGEMCMKTVVKHHAKYLPQCVELAQALIVDERSEMGRPQRISLTGGSDNLLAEVNPAEDPETPAEKADKTPKTPAKGKSKLDSVVEAARAAKAAEGSPAASEAQKDVKPFEGTDDGPVTNDDDWNDIGTAVFDSKNKVSMKMVTDHVTQTMGYKNQRDLTKARLPEVLQWIAAKSK